MYRKAGLECTTQELPDHLPAYLEFASLQPEEAALELLRDVDHLLADIGGALASRGSPYAAVLVALLRVAGERDPASLLKGVIGKDGAAGEDDTAPAAIDRAWAEEPVSFLGARSPQASCTPPRHKEQPITIVRRAA
jgi:nitrate reductase molybdenum cofactor assembly chaperone NarJ/NarW